MRYLLIMTIILGLAACSSSKGAVNSSYSDSSLNGEWKMNGNFMFDSVLVFNRLDKAAEPEEYEEVYIINNGDLKYEIRTELGICGNGLFYLDTASVVINKKNVNVLLDGGYMVESKFIYGADYKLTELTDNRFILSLKKVNKVENHSLYDMN